MTTTRFSAADRAMLAVLEGMNDRIARLESRVDAHDSLLAKLTADNKPSRAASPAKPKADAPKTEPKVKAAPAAKAAPAPKVLPPTTYYVAESGDLYVGVLPTEGGITFEGQIAVHQAMQAKVHSAYGFLNEKTGAIRPFVNPPSVRIRGGYAVMRVGRPNGKADVQHMASTALGALGWAI